MRAILGQLNGQRLYNLAVEAGRFSKTVDVAVAYAETSELGLLEVAKKHGMRLTFYGLLDEGLAVSPGFLRELLALGPSIASARLVRGHFHAKTIWWRGFGAYVGSANLTDKAWFRNVEAGIFLTESELASSGVGADLDGMFDHLARSSVPVIAETIEKLERLKEISQPVDLATRALHERFDSLFANVARHPALAVREKATSNRSMESFAAEWSETLQVLRGLSREFDALRLRPRWLAADVNPTVHFDQFLHAYYYAHVREAQDVEEGATGRERIEDFFERNQSEPAAALDEAARWWAGLEQAPFGEDDFVQTIAPRMRKQFSRASLSSMGLPEFQEALRHVNAFRTHSRQVRNEVFGLPADHHEDQESRGRRLSEWLWAQRSVSGEDVRDLLNFVIWSSSPTDMERRLWEAISSPERRIEHLGRSILGEIIGWARPDEFPPRNNRTNKALRCLGHDVTLFSD